ATYGVIYAINHETRLPGATVDHFPIIQALCRAALAQSQPSPAVRKQIERLKEALAKDGDAKSAGALSALLTAAERSSELLPSRIARSRGQVAGENLTRNTPLPVDRETSAAVAEVIFPNDTKPSAPIFNTTVSGAIQTVLEEWTNLEALANIGVQPSKTC